MEIPSHWPKRLMPRPLTADKWLKDVFLHSDLDSWEFVERFRVSKVVHYKEGLGLSKWMHEFLVATLLDTAPPGAAANLDESAGADLHLRCERAPDEQDDDTSPSDDNQKTSSKFGRPAALSSVFLKQPMKRVD